MTISTRGELGSPGPKTCVKKRRMVPWRMAFSVVLSGGGARGAYEAGVLSYVFGELFSNRPVDFHTISGTSIGAVNGAHLAAAVDAPGPGMERLRSTWSTFDLADKANGESFFIVWCDGEEGQANLPWAKASARITNLVRTDSSASVQDTTRSPGPYGLALKLGSDPMLIE